MEGVIVNFRRAKHRQKKRQMVIRVKSVNTKEEAQKMIGKKVTWKSTTGKEIKGEVTNTHGNKGVLRVQFEKGLPGQSIGGKVSVE